MSGLSLYPKKRKLEICTFSYRQSFHVGNAEYFVSGEGSTFYSELWSSTYSDTHVYDGGYFIGSNDFETDLTQKYKVIKIAPELYEEKSQ